ncbi:MAG: pyridoxal phosphate-dependent aminotransferase [Candidatus Eremiobacteraeota bacterium]|nr:pyridoxal phosphate-dependent aminotransferase [Candidatus Eremiobacteraeota bacterium]
MISTEAKKEHFYIAERTKKIKGSGIRKAFDMASQLKDAIHLGLGEPDFNAPEELKMLLKMAVDEGYDHYTPNAGFLDFRTVLAEKLEEENGIEYDPEKEIMVTVGAMNAIHLAILSIVNPGDEVIMQDPSFVGFEPCILMAGGVPVKVALREEFDFEVQIEDIEAKITDKTKMLILNTPHNPTGAVIPRQTIEKIADLALRNDIFIIADEVYEKLIYDGREHVSIASLPGMKERTLTVHSFSKTFCICGWRIGYAAGPIPLINEMIKFQQFDSVHPPAPIQKAVLFYLSRSNEFVDYVKKVYVSRRDYMVDRLNSIDDVSCIKPHGAFYIFLNIKQLECTSGEFARFLLEKYRVVTIPGTALGDAGEGYIRICLTVPIEQLEVACIRIEKAVKQVLRNGGVE